MKRLRDTVSESDYLGPYIQGIWFTHKRFIPPQQKCTFLVMLSIFITLRRTAGLPPYPGGDEASAFRAFLRYQVGLRDPTKTSGFMVQLSHYYKWKENPAVLQYRDALIPILLLLGRLWFFVLKRKREN